MKNIAAYHSKKKSVGKVPPNGVFKKTDCRLRCPNLKMYNSIRNDKKNIKNFS